MLRIQMMLGLVIAAMAVLFLVKSPSALAHVEVEVGDGQYVMEVGFRDEPALLGQPNAIFVQVEKYATGGTEPVNGLAATLKAEVTKGGASLTLPLVPTGDGVYEAIFVPTETGDYTFHIFGAVEDATVDEIVTSSPTTFNSVEPLTAVEFPAVSADPAQLAASAQTDASSARLFGLAGIAAGVLGLLLAIVALARSGRPAAAAPLPPTTSEPTGKLIR